MKAVYHNLDDVLPLCHCTYAYNESGQAARLWTIGARRSARARPAIMRKYVPTSPQARFLPMGPTMLYLTTSLTIRICSAVRGCSYIKVFIAGKIKVGVVGASARIRDVYHF